jgi:hypothetical protein
VHHGAVPEVHPGDHDPGVLDGGDLVDADALDEAAERRSLLVRGALGGDEAAAVEPVAQLSTREGEDRLEVEAIPPARRRPRRRRGRASDAWAMATTTGSAAPAGTTPTTRVIT